jgi:hypothetical protein
MVTPCIFCGASIGAELGTKEEHVMPAALGGFLASRNIDCNACNETIGNEIEKPACAALQPLTGPLGVVRDGRRAALAPPHVVTAAGFKWKLQATGVRLAGVTRKITEHPGDRYDFSVHAPTIAEVIEQLAHMCRQKKKHPSKMTGESMSNFFGPFRRGEPVDLGSGSFKVATTEQLRMAAKMAVSLLAHVGNVTDAADVRVAVTAAETAPSRIWARGGRSTVDVVFDITTTASSGLLSGDLSTFASSIEVWTTDDRTLLARVVLFGHLQYTMTVARPWPAQPVAVAYWIDPLVGKSTHQFVHQLGTTRAVPPTWQHRAPPRQEDADRMAAQLEAAYLRHVKQRAAVAGVAGDADNTMSPEEFKQRVIDRYEQLEREEDEET